MAAALAAAAAATAAVAAAAPVGNPAIQQRAFKPYGSPPPFDLEAERDTFPIWEERWNIFIALSTIDEALDAALRPAYKTNQLKSCLSTPTLQAVMSAGLTAAQLKDHTAIIDLLRTRCNAGRNRHVWRHQFAVLYQLPNQTADNWLCSLRDVSRKCDFSQDCCANCEPTRILGQLIAGVADNAVRIKMLEQGDALTLDQALTILRTAEATQSQAASLQTAESAINAIRRSAYKTGKTEETKEKQLRFAHGTKPPMEKSATPGKTCDHCGKSDHFAKVCEGTAKPIGAIYIQNLATSGDSELVELSIAPNGQTAQEGTVIHACSSRHRFRTRCNSALHLHFPFQTYPTSGWQISKNGDRKPHSLFRRFQSKIKWTGDGGPHVQ
ncbi:hypothetical protein GHT06_004908 [Daphnia sinensis]|uniref:CCHC-type domain-containing protein n=1 Tax=Daphnia sinensis TaxID=1820382 RepID=A0AAD5L3Z2_9CRUS|nr:hypothetical protein GHT06_004908 [Daphnia sinensis]